MGYRCKTISRNTLANTKMQIARPLYADDRVDTEFKVLMCASVHALDSTTIDLYLSLSACAPFCSTRPVIKLHTLLDLRGAIHSLIRISDGKIPDYIG